MLSKILLKVWSLLRGNVIWLLLLAAALAVPLGYGATLVHSEATIEMNMDPHSQEYKDLVAMKQNFSDQTLVVIVMGNDVGEILSDQNLAAMKHITDKSAEYDEVLFALSPEYFVSTLKQFNQVPADATPEEIVLDADGNISPTFTNFFPNHQNALVTIGLWKSIETDRMSDIIKEMKGIIDEAGFDNNVEYTLSGMPIMMDYQAREMPNQMNTFMSVGIVLILVSLVIFFRVRGSFLRRWLVLGVVGISILFTYGLMGFLDIPLTFMSMVTLPILLGLGVDYAVQFHSRYDEESRKGKPANECVIETLKHTGPPIIIAMLLCMAGLVSAVLVKSPQTQYFGKSLLMGVGICMIMALSLLLGILYLLDKRNDTTRKPEPRGPGWLEKAMGGLLSKTTKYAVPIVLIGAILGGIGWYMERNIKTFVGIEISENVKEVGDLVYLQKINGGISPLDVIIESDNVLKPELLQWAWDKSNELVEKEGIALGEGHYVGSVTSLATTFQYKVGGIPKTAEQAEAVLGMMPKPTWINLVTEDHTALHICISNSSANNKPIEHTINAMREIFVNPPDNAKVTLTGLSFVGVETASLLDETRKSILIWGIGFILLGLCLALKFNIRRIISAAVPVLFVLGWGALFMKASDIRVSSIMALLPAQMIAIGIEFTILLLMRYYEERDKGEDPMLAMHTAITKIGRAILVSGCMVIFGFGVLILAVNYNEIRHFGIVTVVDMVLILVSTLVVLPALVLMFDKNKCKVTSKVPKAIDRPKYK